ncbi:putative uncharacterized protein DDB_G0287457 isoform X1 [Maniola jurtina]|uniref:putative uncharacterized protein DDB_G0287457 isoform X1 n=1 Tax=Maniola jurtina TaxID=191418 RepID=UPI001E68A149|nr:putative uncharacterized protein DDB_G0287457 isoform X1 [Maniola jurtina]
MADSFFGFDTSLSNLNDDEGGGEPSEDEYDALNDETFGEDSEEFDWEVEHEQLAGQLESNRRYAALEEADSRLEASLSQLVLDETDAPLSRSLGSSVWRHDVPLSTPTRPTPGPALKNVCTVEELERQLRQNQAPANFTQNYFQPRFPVILQRPPGLQAPVPPPFAPAPLQQPTNMAAMNQSLNKIIGQNNQMGQTNPMMNHMTQNINQMGPNMSQMNQMGQSMNQMGQTINQMSQNMSQMGQGVNQMGQNMGQNVSQMGQNMNQMNHNQFMQNSNQMTFQNSMGQGMMNQMQNMHQIGQNNVMQNQMGQSMNQMGQNMNQMGQSLNQMGHNMNQMIPNVNQMPNTNQMGQNVNQIRPNMNKKMNQMGQNQMIPNGNQFGMNQFSHNMMSQPRMIPPPGMGMPRQNFSPNMNQFNQNFRGPSIPPKNEQPISQPNMIMNQPMKQINQMNQNMNQQIKPMMNQSPPNNQKQAQNLNQSVQNMNQSGQQNLNHNVQNLNQSGQNLNQPGQNVNQPKIKSRVYNNKNLTSQNLVQLIQNTHPMLQFNNSFHNASHHPMLNNRLFNNQNNMMNNHPMFNRQNGSFGNSNRHSNSDDSASESDDPYMGLMTQREKQWLINIQMLQLNTGTPYIHDFYYTVFLERQANKEKEGIKEAHKANQQNHPFYSGGVKQESETLRHNRERHNSHRHNSTSEDAPRTYVPTQFENSLGKLQCGSVTAPRKIIDVEVVAEPASDRASRAPSVCSTTTPAEVPREMRRTKQMLLDIEALYLILLRLEELNDPLAISNALILKEREEKQKLLEAAQKEAENEPEEDSNSFLKTIESVQRRPKQDSPKSDCIDKRQVVNLAVNQKPVPVKNLLDEDKDEILNKMFAGLLFGDRVPQMMTVRKGRVLLSRFLLRAPGTHARLRALWSRILRALPSASRRDDGGLAALSPHYRKYMQNSTGWAAVIESCGHLAEALDPARTPHALTSALTLSCVCALMERAILLVNTPEATSNERQWYKFLKTLARALKNTTLTVARPTQPLPEPKVMQHIKQLESRSTIEILQRGKAADFDLTKNDVSEQLVKHLC